MKRSKPLKEIFKILKKWENSMVEMKMAEEIFSKLEDMDLIVPPQRKRKSKGSGEIYMDANGDLVARDFVWENTWKEE
jgi:hypothetical protein